MDDYHGHGLALLAKVMVGENKKHGGRQFGVGCGAHFDVLHQNFSKFRKNGLITTPMVFLQMAHLGQVIYAKKIELRMFSQKVHQT